MRTPNEYAERQQRILKDMGITVWHLRTEQTVVPADVQLDVPTPRVPMDTDPDRAAASEVAVQTTAPEIVVPEINSAEIVEPIKPVVVESIEPIGFHWLANATAMVLSAPEQAAPVPFVKDLLAALAWHNNHTEKAQLKVRQGEFKWPQLDTATGTPERTLKAFVDKHCAQARWILMGSDVVSQLQRWQPELVARAGVFDLLAASQDMQAKERLWQQLVG